MGPKPANVEVGVRNRKESLDSPFVLVSLALSRWLARHRWQLLVERLDGTIYCRLLLGRSLRSGRLLDAADFVNASVKEELD